MRPSEPAGLPEPAAILWRRLDLPGHDSALLRAVEQGWQLEGAAVFSHDGRACCLRYSVDADDRWRTTRRGSPAGSAPSTSPSGAAE